MLSPRVRRLCGLVVGAVLAGQVAASAQTIAFPGSPADIDVTFMSPPAAGLVSVGVSMTISHTRAGHLTATLAGGQRVRRQRPDTAPERGRPLTVQPRAPGGRARRGHRSFLRLPDCNERDN